MTCGSPICHVPRHRVSGFHEFVRNDSLYTDEFMELLEKLELAYRDDWGDLKVIDPLVGGKHQYPTLEMDEGIVSVPSNGRLFAICRSMVRCATSISLSHIWPSTRQGKKPSVTSRSPQRLLVT